MAWSLDDRNPWYSPFVKGELLSSTGRTGVRTKEKEPAVGGRLFHFLDSM
jgi:hypothetical protein